MERLGLGIPPFFDTVSPSCLYNFILDRPVLYIVRDILAIASVAHSNLLEDPPPPN